METPSSTRRVTRSQTLAAAAANNSANNFSTLRKTEESEIGLTKSRNRNNGKKQQDRSALFDITNESPIIGLAMGSLETPLSSSSSSAIMLSKKRIISPGSGEALLRGQVRTLLQKVEEEAELSKLSLENRPAFLNNNLQGFLNSPLNFIAPTPANTPQIFFSQTNGLASFSQSPVEDKFLISLQMGSEIFEGKKQESNLTITRSLLQDFSEKSEGYCSSELTYQGGGESEGKKSAIITDDDDSSSIWFIQVNASTVDDGQEVEEEEEDDEEGLEEEEEDDEEGLEEDCENDYIYSEGEEEEEEKEDEGLVVDELCDAVSKISVNGGEMEKFTGKHTRFVYNSDDELQGGEESASSAASSPRGLKLRGLPTPKGKHVRFPDDS